MAHRVIVIYATHHPLRLNGYGEDWGYQRFHHQTSSVNCMVNQHHHKNKLKSFTPLSALSSPSEVLGVYRLKPGQCWGKHGDFLSYKLVPLRSTSHSIFSVRSFAYANSFALCVSGLDHVGYNASARDRRRWMRYTSFMLRQHEQSVSR